MLDKKKTSGYQKDQYKKGTFKIQGSNQGCFKYMRNFLILIFSTELNYFRVYVVKTSKRITGICLTGFCLITP